KAMPTKTDMPDVVLELSQLARDTGISFDSISPQAIAAVGSYSVLPISVTFNGNFYNLADFLYRLRSLVTVHAGRLDATGRLFSPHPPAHRERQKKFPHTQAPLATAPFAPPPPPAAPPAATPPSTTTTTTGETTTTPSSSASATGAP